MKYSLVNLALLGNAAAFPAVRGILAPNDVKDVFRRGYVASPPPEDSYPTHPIYTPSSSIQGYPTPSASHSYPIGTGSSHQSYPTEGPSSEPHPDYPTGGNSGYPTGKPPGGPHYPTGKPPGGPEYPTGGHPYPTGGKPPHGPYPTSYPGGDKPTTYPGDETSTKTKTEYNTEYTTSTHTEYETVCNTYTSFYATSTPVYEGSNTHWSSYAVPTTYTKTETIAHPTTVVIKPTGGAGYPSHPEGPSNNGNGNGNGSGYCPAPTVVQTETVYVTVAPPAQPTYPSGEHTFTYTDKYGDSTVITIPGTAYPGHPEPTTYVEPIPEPTTYPGDSQSSKPPHSLPPYPTGGNGGHSGYPTGPTGTGVHPHPHPAPTGYPHHPAPSGGYPHVPAPSGGYPHQPAPTGYVVPPTEGYPVEPQHPEASSSEVAYPTTPAYPTKAWYALF